MSSPKFNNITVVGCLMCYMEVFVSAYSNSTSARHESSNCYVRIHFISKSVLQYYQESLSFSSNFESCFSKVVTYQSTREISVININIVYKCYY